MRARFIVGAVLALTVWAWSFPAVAVSPGSTGCIRQSNGTTDFATTGTCTPTGATFDFGAATLELPNATTAPSGACTDGLVKVQSDGSPGNILFVCVNGAWSLGLDSATGDKIEGSEWASVVAPASGVRLDLDTNNNELNLAVFSGVSSNDGGIVINSGDSYTLTYRANSTQYTVAAENLANVFTLLQTMPDLTLSDTSPCLTITDTDSGDEDYSACAVGDNFVFKNTTGGTGDFIFDHNGTTLLSLSERGRLVQTGGTLSGAELFFDVSPPTVAASSGFKWLSLTGTVNIDGDPGLVAPLQALTFTPNFAIDDGTDNASAGMVFVEVKPAISISGASQGASTWDNIANTPVVHARFGQGSITNTGSGTTSLSLADGVVGVEGGGGTVGTGVSLAFSRGLEAKAWSGAGGLPIEDGLYIPELTKGGVVGGIKNASTTITTPQTHAIAAAPGTINDTALLINNASGYTVGVSSINLDAADGGVTGTMLAGDTFTIAGDSTRYWMTATKTASDNAFTAVTFVPSLQVAAADNAAVTVTLGYTINPRVSTRAITAATGTLTLTSVPSILDGVDGQELEILNVDGTATDCIVLQDDSALSGSNIRLTSRKFKMCAREGILLKYNATVGDWLERARYERVAAPAVSSCGTSAPANTTGTDQAGKVTTGTSATGCIITFDKPFTDPPSCTVSSSVDESYTVTTSTTALTIGGAASGQPTYSYRCDPA